MQRGTEQIKRQQQLLFVKGFYNGKIDGVWSDKTIEAKKKWERSGTFYPCIPNNGLPFADVGKYPVGVYRDKRGLLSCADLESALANPAYQFPSGEVAEAPDDRADEEA